MEITELAQEYANFVAEMAEMHGMCDRYVYHPQALDEIAYWVDCNVSDEQYDGGFWDAVQILEAETGMNLKPSW